jgi:hypothetical protein
VGRGVAGERSALEQLRVMERWMRVLAATQPEPLGAAAAAVSAVLVVGAFAV